MNQIMNWMDDTDNQYDGIPVNWTAWNLHMSSSPKMLYSWDYKTTAYNGTHIKNRLLSYNTAPEKLDVYIQQISAQTMYSEAILLHRVRLRLNIPMKAEM